jgi:GNAT superfamily N-acetyltransferase
MQREEVESKAIRFTEKRDGKTVGRASLFLIFNRLHEKPYGLLEDVFVEKDCRGQGIGNALANAIIDEAKEQGCYKLLAQSRYGRDNVHKMYAKLGFKDHGKNFRLDFN